MTRDEILDEYEALWRGAALRDDRQFFGYAAGGGIARLVGNGARYGDCAWLHPERLERPDLTKAAQTLAVRWQCECGYATDQMSVLMIHLNNAHLWTWDMFAGKFRDALAAGEARAIHAPASVEPSHRETAS